MNKSRGSLIVICILSVLTVLATSTKAASFQGLGFLQDDHNSSYANAISADGSTVVGCRASGSVAPLLRSESSPEMTDIDPLNSEEGSEAFRWTKEEGIVSLGFLSENHITSTAREVSGDGSVILGGSGPYALIGGDNEFIWTSENGMVGIGDLGSNGFGRPQDISDDGTIVVGRGSGVLNSQAFRWTYETGAVGLGFLPAVNPLSYANAISADGLTVVGSSNSSTASASGTEAFLWTLDKGITGLGFLSEYSSSYAVDVSGDGLTVVGNNYQPYHHEIDGKIQLSSNQEPFRWTYDDGMIGLGHLPESHNRTMATGISADGSIIIGFSIARRISKAFVWDEVNGMRSLQDLLVDLGVDLTGWSLTEATDISADGLVIVGNGTNPEGKLEAWIATIPELRIPASYYVDGVYGSDHNDGRSVDSAFATIQFGIDAAVDGDSVFVLPGVYNENIVFDGKAITVSGIGGAPIIDGDGYWGVSFFDGETSESVLKNVIITNCYMGIFLSGSSPTISNVNIVGNMFGIEAYSQSEPDVANCILWDNSDGDVFGCEVNYSCIERSLEGGGIGNINKNPYFVDAAGGDYHLRSRRGRYWAEHDVWVLDYVDSPCIDGGSIDYDPVREPVPNGGKINMGAYGGTMQASMSDRRLHGDIKRDGRVDMEDISILSMNWLKSESWPQVDDMNIEEGIGLIDHMVSNIETIQDTLVQAMTTAKASESPALSDDDRIIMNTNFQNRITSINHYANGQFDGISMLNNPNSNVRVATVDGIIKINSIDLTVAGLFGCNGTTCLSISDVDSAVAVQEKIHEATEAVAASYVLYCEYINELENQL